MALPTNLVQDTQSLARSGIIVGLSPSTGAPMFRIELQLSTQSSTASTNWTSLFLDPTSGAYRHTVPLPPSTRSVFFRARHFLDGYSNGPFTNTVSAKPVLLPDMFQPLMPLRNNLGNVEILGGDLWLSSSKTAKVGTQQTTGVIAKLLTFHANSFQAEAPTVEAGVYNVQALQTNAASTATRFFVAQQPLPAGLKLTQLSIAGNRKSTSSIVSVTMYRSGGFGSISTSQFTVALPVNSTAIPPQTANSSALNFTVAASEAWTARLSLRRTSTNVTSAQLIYLRWSYSMPSYEKQY